MTWSHHLTGHMTIQITMVTGPVGTGTWATSILLFSFPLSENSLDSASHVTIEYWNTEIMPTFFHGRAKSAKRYLGWS